MKTKSRRHTGVYVYPSSVKKDECYYIKYRAHGTQVQEKIGWKSEGYSQDQAASIRADRIHAVRHGKELPRKRAHVPTFEVAFDLYTNSKVNAGEKRMYQIKSRYNRYLHSLFGNSKLPNIKSSGIRSMIKLMESDGMHRSTIKHYMGIISMVFDYMIAEHGYKGTNPVKSIVYSSGDRRRERWLTKDEANQLLKGMTHASTDLFLQTAILMFTGMRLGEVMSIRGRDINYETGQIRVTGKGRDGVPKERYCEMNDTVRDLLKDHPLRPNEKLFKSGFRRKAWSRVVDSLGLNDGVESSDRIWRVTPHTLRHTFGSWLGQNGVSPMIIQQVMGHEKIQTSMRYAKLGPRAGQSAVNNITEGLEL